ncbi:hypothetical protein PIB30_022351 [Stylosanthes scabra]|uniref:Ubiquitin-like protease family profile domain-containing protein n=1 Tax=Stylosanthes scabra TaxID=79078 RepID=A0ABU6WA92_9FABA|nr:hypothetical protein [Stylosanthes scabra]
MPSKTINGDVLVLVCSMLNYGAFEIKASKLGSQWYLPPTFSQVALSTSQKFGIDILNYIKENFMTLVISPQKIFLPIHLLGHWFLVELDLVYRTVSCFNSFKGCILKSDCDRAIERVVKFLLRILSQGFYNPHKRSFEYSEYKFKEMDVPQQHPKSNDYGIWVSQWMILSCYVGTNHKWVVNDYTRMKLAVDLVNGEHNPKRDTIKELAVIDWNQKMQHSVMQT